MYKVIAPNVLYFESIIDTSDLFIDALDRAGNWEPWYPGGVEYAEFTYGTLKKFEANLGNKLSDTKDIRLVVNTLKKVNLICGTEYLKYVGASDKEISRLKKATLTDKIPLGVKKYIDGGPTLGPHPDADPESDESEISITFYPNDDYDGGELRFTELDLQVKPVKGSAFVYPSKYIHESLPATNGEKLVSNYVYLAKEKLWK
jgi:hypothetical protein